MESFGYRSVWTMKGSKKLHGNILIFISFTFLFFFMDTLLSILDSFFEQGLLLVSASYFIIVAFIVSGLLYGYSIRKISIAFDSRRLEDLSTLIFLSVGLIIVLPLIPYFGFILVTWGFISLYLVSSVIIYLYAVETFNPELKVVGLLGLLFSFFVVSKIGIFVEIICLMVFYNYVRITFPTFAFWDANRLKLLKEEFLDKCRTDGIVDIKEFGLKFGLNYSKLIGILVDISSEVNCRANKISGKIICQC